MEITDRIVYELYSDIFRILSGFCFKYTFRYKRNYKTRTYFAILQEKKKKEKIGFVW